MKFEKDFDFESANAQFNKEEIDREFQSKLKLKGNFYYKFILFFFFLDFPSVVSPLKAILRNVILRI